VYDRGIVVAGYRRSEGTSWLQNAAVRHQRGSVRRAQVAATAAGTDQVAGLRAGRLRWQHAQSRRARHPRHEHCPAVYEGTRQPDPGTPGEQQLLFHQHKHRPGRLRVVRRSRRVLGRRLQPVRKEQPQLPARLMVARARGPVRRECPCLPLPTATRGPGLGQLWLRPLGPGSRVV